jgi:hypothetical protein
MGLIDYFFAYDTERENAVESIEKSGVKVPEAEIIVKREKKLLEYERDSLQRFFALAKKYLADRAIPTKLRKEMKVRLERFSRFKSIADEISIGEEDDEVAATLKDIQARGEILHKRMRNIMKTKLKEAGTEVKERYNELMAEMDETTQALADTTKHLESTEQEIMVNSGEFLLSEEEKSERREGKQNQGS